MKQHINVCIATYNRPRQLKKLLTSLIMQRTNECFSYSIIIVDNDKNYSSKSVVDDFKMKSYLKIEYYMQPEKNISKTRNMCVKKSNSDYIAFIDDDEYACNEWLYELYFTMKKYNVDVVNGPVSADFTYPVTELRKNFFCITYYNSFNKPINRQGQKKYLIKSTNNCLIKSSVIKKYKAPFDPDYGLCGGGDTDFFLRMSKLGVDFCWAAKAVVYEQIPFRRCTLNNIIKRIIRNGNVNIRIETNQNSINKKQLIYLFYLFKFIFWFLLFPVFIFIGLMKRNYFLYYIHKLIFYIGVMSDIFSVKIYEYK